MQNIQIQDFLKLKLDEDKVYEIHIMALTLNILLRSKENRKEFSTITQKWLESSCIKRCVA